MQTFRNLTAGLALAFCALGLPSGTASAQSGGWGGLYAGVNVGWIGKDFDWAFNPPIIGAAHQAYSFGDDDGIVGGHVGIQTQWSQFVLGVEAAYSSSGVFGNNWSREPLFGNNPAFDSIARTGPIFTIGPRLGWAPNNQWLLFIGGGYASTTIRTAAISLATGAHAFETSERHDGWYLGGGIEFALTPNLIFGVEYQHLDFGKELHCPGAACLGAAAGFVDRDIDLSADVVRARLSFKLGREERYAEPLK